MNLFKSFQPFNRCAYPGFVQVVQSFNRSAPFKSFKKNVRITRSKRTGNKAGNPHRMGQGQFRIRLWWRQSNHRLERGE